MVHPVCPLPRSDGPADVPGNFRMFAEFHSDLYSGVPGGTLSIDHGVYPASSALPANGDFIWSNGAGASINSERFPHWLPTNSCFSFDTAHCRFQCNRRGRAYQYFHMPFLRRI